MRRSDAEHPGVQMKIEIDFSKRMKHILRKAIFNHTLNRKRGGCVA